MAAKKAKDRRPKKITSAEEILYRRYIKGKPERMKSLRDVTAAMTLGEYIRELRERKEVTQQQLADLIGTKRTAISRLESADYQGHSVELLCRIVRALHGKLMIRIETEKDSSNVRDLVLVG